MNINTAQPKPYQLYIVIAISVLAWSFGPICVRYAFEYDMPPDLIASLRMVIGALVFAPFVWTRYKHEVLKMSPRHIMLAVLSMIGIR